MIRAGSRGLCRPVGGSEAVVGVLVRVVLVLLFLIGSGGAGIPASATVSPRAASIIDESTCRASNAGPTDQGYCIRKSDGFVAWLGNLSWGSTGKSFFCADFGYGNEPSTSSPIVPWNPAYTNADGQQISDSSMRLLEYILGKYTTNGRVDSTVAAGDRDLYAASIHLIVRHVMADMYFTGSGTGPGGSLQPTDNITQSPNGNDVPTSVLNLANSLWDEAYTNYGPWALTLVVNQTGPYLPGGSYTATATLKQGSNKVLAGKPVTVAATNATITGSPGTTNANGQVTVTFKPTAGGTTKLTASVAGAPVGGYVNLLIPPGWAANRPSNDQRGLFGGNGTESLTATASVSVTAPFTPGLATTVSSQTAAVGAKLSDTIRISVPTGSTLTSTTLTSRLYGPFTAPPTSGSCIPAKLFDTITTAGVSGSGTITRVAASTKAISAAGYYTFTAALAATASSNAVAETGCGTATETSTVSTAAYTVTTKASTQTAEPGDAVTDTITVTGWPAGASAQATAVLWGPFDNAPGADSCQAPAGMVGAAVTVTIDRSGDVTTPPVTIPATSNAGYFTWVVTVPATPLTAGKTTACGDPAETVKVTGPARISTVASHNTLTQAELPFDVTDTVTASGLLATTTASVTGTLWGPFATRPAAGACAAGAPVAGTVTWTFTGNGTFTSPKVTITAAGFYVWEQTVTSADTDPVTEGCGKAEQTIEVATTPVIDTQRSNPATIDAPQALVDRVIVGNLLPGDKPTIDLRLYGPFDAPPGSASCTPGTLVETITFTADRGDGTYEQTTTATVSTPGYYTFVAEATGGALSTATDPTVCGDPKETTLLRAPIELSTTAVRVEQAGGKALISDEVTVGGAGFLPGAEPVIHGTLFGPFDTAPGPGSCLTGPRVGTRTVTATGPGTYTLDPLAVYKPGHYTWVVFATGTEMTLPAASPCGLPAETVVNRASPPSTATIITDSTDLDIDAPTAVGDKLTMKGFLPGTSPQVTSTLHGPYTTPPTSQTCVDTPKPVGDVTWTAGPGDGTWTSPTTLTADKPGYYAWSTSVAATDLSTAYEHGCGEVGETLRFTATPKVTTAASSSLINAGGTVRDTITVSGLPPTARPIITAVVYGPFEQMPDPGDCTAKDAPVLYSEQFQADRGNSAYTTNDVVAPAPGYYSFVVRVGGTHLSTPTGPEGCGDPAESFLVQPAPTITTTAAGGVAKPGAELYDTITISGLLPGTPMTTVKAILYGPFDRDVAGPGGCPATAPVWDTVTVPVTGNGTFTSPKAKPLERAGWYSWGIEVPPAPAPRIGGPPVPPTWQGLPAVCGIPAETVGPTPGRIAIEKVALQPGPYAPGDVVTYTVTARNLGDTTMPATWTDDLGDVIDDSTFNDDATSTSDPADASPGTTTWNSPKLTWAGDLVGGQIVTTTYSVTIRTDGGGLGNGLLLNRVTGGNQSCPPGPNPDDGCWTSGQITGDGLAYTGAGIARITATAATLLAAGALLVRAARRRRSHAND